MLHLDFEFRLDDTRLAIVGWCSAERLDSFYIQDQDKVLFPITVSHHPRRDLRSDDLRGFVAVFETKVGSDLAQCSFRAEGEDSLFALDGSEAQFGAFVHKAVDETFWDFCRCIGAGELPLVGADRVATIRQRIQNALGNYGETPRMAAGLDQAVATQPCGVALLSGWIATDRTQNATHPLQRAAFAVCEGALVPITMYWDCHLRPDLSGFGDRFSLTGQEGFAGLLHVGPEHGRIETVVICAQYRRGLVVLARNVDDVSAGAVLDLVQMMDQNLNTAALLQDTRISLRPQAVAVPLNALGAFPQTSSAVTLVLDHDGQDHDIRDVLRFCRTALGARIELLLMRKSISRSLKRAIEADRNEAGQSDLSFAHCAPDTAINQWPLQGDVVLFASSSALMQLEPLGMFAGLAGAQRDGAVVVYDPVLGLGAAPMPAQLARRLAAGRLPFVAMLNMAVLPPELTQFGGFATAEAQVRMLILSLYRAGRIDIGLARPGAFFDGNAGRHDPEGKTTALLAGLDSEAIAEAFAGVNT